MAMSTVSMVWEAASMARGRGQNKARVAHAEGGQVSDEVESLVEEWDGDEILRHQPQPQPRRRIQRYNRIISMLVNSPISCFTGGEAAHIGERDQRMGINQMSGDRQMGGHIREDIHLRMATAMSIVYGWLI